MTVPRRWPLGPTLLPVFFIIWFALGAIGIDGVVRPSGNEGVVKVPDPSTVYDPVSAGESLPAGFIQLLARDEIPPIYAPRFVPASSDPYPDDTLVLGVALENEAHAYPIDVLNWREIVVDEVGGMPILSTWCPICATAMVHRRELDGAEIVFGNQGALYKDAMTWWDHDTGSVWSQPTGEAILGPRKAKSSSCCRPA